MEKLWKKSRKYCEQNLGKEKIEKKCRKDLIEKKKTATYSHAADKRGRPGGRAPLQPAARRGRSLPRRQLAGEAAPAVSSECWRRRRLPGEAGSASQLAEEATPGLAPPLGPRPGFARPPARSYTAVWAWPRSTAAGGHPSLPGI